MSVSLANWNGQDSASDSEYDDAQNLDLLFLDKLTRLENDVIKRKVSKEYLCHQSNYLSYVDHLLSGSDDNNFAPRSCESDSESDDCDENTKESLLAEGKIAYLIQRQNNLSPWEEKLSELEKYLNNSDNPNRVLYVSQMLDAFDAESVQQTLVIMQYWKNISTLFENKEIGSFALDDTDFITTTVERLDTLLSGWDAKAAEESAGTLQKIKVLVNNINYSAELTFKLHEELINLNLTIIPDQGSLEAGLQNVIKFLPSMQESELKQIIRIYFTIANDLDSTNAGLFKEIQSEFMRIGGGKTRVIVRFRNDDTEEEEFKGVTQMDFMPKNEEPPTCDESDCYVRGTAIYKKFVNKRRPIDTIGSKYRYQGDTHEWTELEVGLKPPDKKGNVKARDVHKIFKPETTQENVYAYVENFLLSATNGNSICLAFYGGSGSGKTHTAMGNEKDKTPTGAGVIPRLLESLLSKTKNDRKISIRCVEIIGVTGPANGSKVQVNVYPEPETEQKITLLDKQLYKPRTTSENHSDTWQFDGVNPENTTDALQFFEKCVYDKRKVDNNGVHERSSRGHMFFQITVTQGGKESYVYVCDLAGSESIKQYANGLNDIKKTKELLKQSDMINDSLFKFIKLYKQKEQSDKPLTDLPKVVDFSSAIYWVLEPIFTNIDASLALIVCLYPILVKGPGEILVQSNKLSGKKEEIRKNLHKVGGIMQRIKMNHFILQSLQKTKEDEQNEQNFNGFFLPDRFPGSGRR